MKVQKLYVVGFTSDLRGLILSRQKGVKSGGFVVALDDQLRRTIDEVYRRNAASSHPEVPRPDEPTPDEAVETEPAPEAPLAESGPRRTVSRGALTPKEIQAELRAGKTVQQVARMANTDVSWIERFLSPILAERKGIVDAVMGGVISRPRRGKSSCNVGEAIVAYLTERKVAVSIEDLEDAWQVVRRDGQWEVTFRYAVRDQVKEAVFTYDAETGLKTSNATASEMGWRPTDAGRGTERAQQTDEPEDASGAGGTVAPQASASPKAPAKPKASSKPTSSLKPATSQKPAASQKPATSQKPASRREVAAASAALWGATKVTPPTAPARRSNFIGAGKADGSVPPTKQAPGSAARTAGRQQPPPPVKRLPGAADDRPVFARNSSSPRPKRLITNVDDEATWRSAVAKTRAARRGGATPPPEPPPKQPPRAQRKRLPDDWLLDD